MSAWHAMVKRTLLEAAGILRVIVEEELRASISGKKAQVMAQTAQLRHRARKGLTDLAGPQTTEAVVHLGIDYAAGRRLGGLSRPKKRARTATFLKRMRRWKRLRRTAGRRATRVLHAGLLPGYN